MGNIGSALILTGFFFIPQIVLGQPYGAKTGLRELCRREIAGIYLKAFDEKEEARGVVSFAQGNKGRLEVELKGTESFLSSLPLETAEDRQNKESLEAKRSSLLLSLEESTKAIAVYQTKFSERETEVSRILGVLGSLFVLEPFSGPGYPWMLNFRTPCPPYRVSCPLNTKDKEALLAIDKQIPLPLACQRYKDIAY